MNNSTHPESYRAPAASSQTPRPTQKKDTMHAIRMHCPYYQNDPDYGWHNKSCVGPGFETPCRLKEHLHRVHRKETSADAQTSAIASPEETRFGPRQLSKTQHSNIRLLGRSTQLHTSLDIWRDIYRIIFPDEQDEQTPPAFNPSLQNLLAAADSPSDKLISAIVARMMDDQGDMGRSRQDLEVSAKFSLDLLKYFAAELAENGAIFTSSAHHTFKTSKAAAPVTLQDGGIAPSRTLATQNSSTNLNGPSDQHSLPERSIQEYSNLDPGFTDQNVVWLGCSDIEELGDHFMLEG